MKLIGARSNQGESQSNGGGSGEAKGVTVRGRESDEHG